MPNSSMAPKRQATNRNIQRGMPPSEARNPGQPAATLLTLLDHAAGNRTIKAGCDLFSQGERGDAIYHFIDGWAALYNLMEDGRRQILHFAVPGTAFVLIPTAGATMTYGAQALTDATVSVIPFESLQRLARGCPDIGLQLAALIAQDRQVAYDHLSSISRRSARERVAHLLLELFVRYRMRWPGHRIEEMHLPLTQEHIGDATGLTGVHVNRVIRDLRRDGIAEFHYRRLRILNADKLVDAAGVDPGEMFLGLNVRSGQESIPRRDADANVYAFERSAADCRLRSRPRNAGQLPASAL